jgi:hypothetical protein
MTKADLLFERGAAFLEELSRKASADGGFAAKLAEPLREDAAFLRKMKPSLVLARLRGEPPTNGPTNGNVAPTMQPPPPVPEPPQEPKPPKPKKKTAAGGVNPIAVAAGAFVAGILIAKFVDWRGHAHPRF